MAFMLTQVRWRNTGWAGGDGYLPFRVRGQLSGTPLSDWLTALRTFVSTFSTSTPTAVKYTCETQVTYINEADGSIEGVLAITTPPADVNGSGSGNFSSITGGAVCWRTGVKYRRRLVIGRTFFVPLAATAYTSGGALATSLCTSVGTAGGIYVGTPGVGSDGHPVVWRRPSVKGATDGALIDIKSVTLGPYPCELKSRRP